MVSTWEIERRVAFLNFTPYKGSDVVFRVCLDQALNDVTSGMVSDSTD